MKYLPSGDLTCNDPLVGSPHEDLLLLYALIKSLFFRRDLFSQSSAALHPVSGFRLK